mmetsp:Transcript_801/g.2479  ORF Transcript_801/g.2479 Transcript_801/m.2479 type:complete len:143 (+) Transcript_801:2-430(+)
MEASPRAAAAAVALGAVPPLVVLLGSSSLRQREAAAEALAAVAQADEASEARAARAGAVHALLKIARTGLPGEKTAAVTALQHFAFTHGQSIINGGGMPCLERMCQGGTPRQRKVAEATLLQIAAGVESRRQAAEEAAQARN